MSTDPGSVADRREGGAGGGKPASSRRRTLVLAGCAVLLFLASLRLIGSAAEAASVEGARILERFADDAPSALGLGWLLTYGLTNGSVVAALGVTLGAGGMLDPARAVQVVAGSRLGAAAFLMLIGGLDHLRRPRGLRSALGLGTLTFVLSHAVYLPATALAHLALPWLAPRLEPAARALDLGFVQPGFAHALAGAALKAAGPAPVILAGVGGLFLAVLLFDRALRGVDLDVVRRRTALERPWVAFGAGAATTALTASVSFSIGALVPLYGRGALRRQEVAPYVLGANATTLLDTLIVALVVGEPTTTAAILAFMAAATVITLLAVALFRAWSGWLDAVLDGLTRSRAGFAAFIVSLVAAPLLLALLP